MRSSIKRNYRKNKVEDTLNKTQKVGSKTKAIIENEVNNKENGIVRRPNVKQSIKRNETHYNTVTVKKTQNDISLKTPVQLKDRKSIIQKSTTKIDSNNTSKPLNSRQLAKGPNNKYVRPMTAISKNTKNTSQAKINCEESKEMKAKEPLKKTAVQDKKLKNPGVPNKQNNNSVKKSVSKKPDPINTQQKEKSDKSKNTIGIKQQVKKPLVKKEVVKKQPQKVTQVKEGNSAKKLINYVKDNVDNKEIVDDVVTKEELEIYENFLKEGFTLYFYMHESTYRFTIIRTIESFYLPSIYLPLGFLALFYKFPFRLVFHPPIDHHILFHQAKQIFHVHAFYHLHIHLYNVFHQTMKMFLFHAFYCYSILLHTSSHHSIYIFLQ